jgi:dUTPase
LNSRPSTPEPNDEVILDLKNYFNGSVGFTLTSSQDHVVRANDSMIIPTSAWIVFPEGYLGRTVSGPAIKNHPAVRVDLSKPMEEVQGKVNLQVTNASDEDLVIKHGSFVANLIWVKEKRNADLETPLTHSQSDE